MSIEAGIATVVYAGIGIKPFPTLLPENPTLPAITYQFVGGRSFGPFDTIGPQRWRLQFDIYGQKHSDVSTLRDQLIQSFAAPGSYPVRLADGTILNAARFIQAFDHFDSDARQFRIVVEFYIHFNL